MMCFHCCKIEVNKNFRIVGYSKTMGILASKEVQAGSLFPARRVLFYPYEGTNAVQQFPFAE